MKFDKIIFVMLILMSVGVKAQSKPIRIAVVGLTHSHVHWIFNSEKLGEIKIVGIVEANRDLAERYSKQHGYAMDLVYSDIDEMLAAVKPEAVSAFGSIFDHLGVVEKAAPLGIHIMVEKPLAVNLNHAKKMESLVKKHHVQLITNYETTWYASNHKAYKLVEENTIGAIRKVVIRDGHKGPKKIGVNKEFLEWLTDPVLNGGGAITDFGCYGVNLMTWLMKGEKPLSVTAVTQQLQPENNPKVDDDATIILKYADANAIVQASWDWPMGRKDMEIYGLKGAIYADSGQDLRVRIAEGYSDYSEEVYKLEDRAAPYNDPFSFFAKVIRNEIQLKPYSLSSLENNMMVMEILDAATKSAKTNKTIKLKSK